jgi:hypothetical protein
MMLRKLKAQLLSGMPNLNLKRGATKLKRGATKFNAGAADNSHAADNSQTAVPTPMALPVLQIWVAAINKLFASVVIKRDEGRSSPYSRQPLRFACVDLQAPP